MADSWPTIRAVTQAPHPRCPRSVECAGMGATPTGAASCIAGSAPRVGSAASSWAPRQVWAACRRRTRTAAYGGRLAAAGALPGAAAAVASPDCSLAIACRQSGECSGSGDGVAACAVTTRDANRNGVACIAVRPSRPAQVRPLKKRECWRPVQTCCGGRASPGAGMPRCASTRNTGFPSHHHFTVSGSATPNASATHCTGMSL